MVTQINLSRLSSLADLLEDHIWLQLEDLMDTLEKHLLPAFQTAEEEAHKIAKQELERMKTSPENEDEVKWPEALAEGAGMAYYDARIQLKQGLINLFAAATYHLFEQEIWLFCFHAYSTPRKSSVQEAEFRSLLSTLGIELDMMAGWAEIQELKLIANVVKHGSGKSADRLKKLNPKLFINPDLSDLSDADLKEITYPNDVFQPLFGLGLYIPIENLRLYVQAVGRFWKDLMKVVRKLEPSS